MGLLLAARNVVGVLMGYPAWEKHSILSLLEDDPPKAVPSIVNAEKMTLPKYVWQE
ncbi:MAG: hypothetical protein PHY29_10240 [Syntrophales bacterium]|nr:hypothetical protein [Syntrophales bacterium]